MRKCLLFSGHRAERGHIDSIDRGMREHGGVQVQRFNFAADLSSDTLAGQAKAFGASMTAMVPVFEQLAPDFALVYGDRSEAFAAALTAARMGIPIAHVEGGDHTEGGCLDDSTRHAITKLAALHFPTTEDAAASLLAMGEEPWRVRVVGLPILDYAKLTTLDELQRRYRLTRQPLIVVCQHPVAAESGQSFSQIRETIAAVQALDGYQVVAIAPNGDAGSADIRGELCRAFGDRVYESIPVEDFHGMLAAAAVLVGNSSSGIKEAPFFGCPVVNVGTRQSGRLRPPCIVDVDYDREAVRWAAKHARRGDFHSYSYRPLGAGRIIAETLASVNLDGLTIKRRAA